MDYLDFDADLTADCLAIDVDSIMPELPAPTNDELAALMKFIQFVASNPRPIRERKSRGDASRFSEKISIRIPLYLLTLLKAQAKARGIPYQTYINLTLADQVLGKPAV